MSYDRLHGAQSVAKALRPTIEATEFALHELDAGGPTWSYDVCWRLAFLLYSGKITLAAALAACKSKRQLKPGQVDIGEKCTSEVVKIMWQEAQRASYFCHPLHERLYFIRSDLAIPVRPHFYFVRDGVPRIFWLQPWKVFELTHEQLGVLASIIRYTFCVDDFEHAQLHLLNTSADDDEHVLRSTKVLGFDDLPMLSDIELKAAFDRFAAAYDLFIARRKARPEKDRRTPDTGQGKLF